MGGEHGHCHRFSSGAWHHRGDGLSPAAGTDTVYAWYSNGVVYAGSGLEPAAGWRDFAPSPYALPPGKSWGDIVGMGISSVDAVYVWYDDGTATSGTTTDLDAHRTPYAYTLPAGKSPADIVGMAIDKADDHCYAWYSDGTVSAGTSWDLTAYSVTAP